MSATIEQFKNYYEKNIKAIKIIILIGFIFFISLFFAIQLKESTLETLYEKNMFATNNYHLSNEQQKNIKIRLNLTKDKEKKIIFKNKLFPKRIFKLFEKENDIREKNKLKTLFELPWYEEAVENTDFNEIKKIIENSHLELDYVQEQILKVIIARIFNKKNNNRILCFVGGPGCGKTSFAKTIAKALHLPFQKISLAGVADSYQIHGIPNYYIGAKQGKIISAIKESQVTNPVILIDEIDKVGVSREHGNPLDALLEVFDKKQNKKFYDHFLDTEYDVSNVLFIVTANNIEKIPTPLINRMSIINFKSYSNLQRRNIAKNIIIPKMLKRYNLEKNIVFRDDAIDKIVSLFTPENSFAHYVSIRDVEKNIADVLLNILKINITKKDKINIILDEKNIEKYLDKDNLAHYKVTLQYLERKDINQQKDRIGQITGMGVEKNRCTGCSMPLKAFYHNNYQEQNNNNNVTIYTGIYNKHNREKHIQDTDYTKMIISFFKKSNLLNSYEKERLGKMYFSFYMPGGYGGSGGLGIALMIFSLLKNKPIRRDIAVTGEFYNGKIKSIGGLYEKIVGTYDEGYRNFIVPYENYAEAQLIPKRLIKGAKIYYVKNFKEACKIAFRKK